MSRIEPIDYHQEIEVAGVRFSAYNAGHVLGAAMFLIEIAGVRVRSPFGSPFGALSLCQILYTGDFSREEDRHLMAAEVPVLSPDVLIVESTYGTQTHEPRVSRERRFTSYVTGGGLRTLKMT